MVEIEVKMKKYLAGSFCFTEDIKYYTNDFVIFYTEDNKELDIEDLKEWAVWINSPWSQVNEKYEIKCNCRDAYTQIDENEPIWKCEYSIVGYDGISASVIGYGNTVFEALKSCKENFQMLQEKYNTENESF